MIAVRFARPDDCDIIFKFIADLAQFERLAHEVQTSPQKLREQLFGHRPAAEVLIAELNGLAVGFALFFQNFSTFLGRPGIYLEDLFVAPEHRQLGVAGQLMRRLAEIALERNCGRMEWSVLDWNDRAIRYYQSIGAKPMEEWTVYRMTEAAIRELAQSRSK